MPADYLDTSALAKHYHSETGSAAIDRLWNEPERGLFTHYQEAERLLREHGPRRRLRTLDALQLAVALELHQRDVIQRVVSADQDLLAAATAEGLSVLDPEKP